MHTLLITAAGLALLGLILGLARDRAGAARRFIPIWTIICVLHLGYGVGVHHYSLVSELAVHVVVFGAPAGLAFWFIRSARPRS